jgi:hypothetical protein
LGAEVYISIKSIFCVLLFIMQIAKADPIFRVNNNTTQRIDKHGLCKDVNNTSGRDLMVPTQLSPEWSSFASATIPGVAITSCPCVCPDLSEVALGSACTGGGICAGIFQGNKYMITPGDCTNSATPVCSGGADTAVLAKAWDLYPTITSLEVVNPASAASTQSGSAGTAFIVADASVANTSAAHFCNDMTFGGYSDWYLPSKSQLAYLFCNSNQSGSRTAGNPQEKSDCAGAYGGPATTLTGFAAGTYWSTSATTYYLWAWNQNFANGQQAGANKPTAYYEGDPAPGGAICAGTFNGTIHMITPGGCTDSATPTCIGTDTVTKSWDRSTDIPGITNINLPSTPSVELGDSNTSAILAESTIVSPNAAQFCNDMTYGGYNDWYLPSKSELVYIFCNSNRSGNRMAGHPAEQPTCAGNFKGPTTALTGFTATQYWTSTEQSRDNVARVNFTDGSEIATGKDASLYVRCVRRY